MDDKIEDRLKVLELKKIDTENPDTIRILEQTAEACDLLNNYLLDFRETVMILSEKYKASMEKGDSRSAKEADVNMKYAMNRVKEVISTMEALAADMPFLVDIKDA
jgi:hypothetical protein